MGGHIPVKNKRARENPVSWARFIVSEENILPLYQAPGKAFVSGAKRPYPLHDAESYGHRQQ